MNNYGENNKLKQTDIKAISLDNNRKSLDINKYKNIDNDSINTIFKLKKKKNNIILKILITICIILIILLANKIFIFNNKNKFLKETTRIYNNALNIVKKVDEEFSILNSNYININSEYTVNLKDKTKDSYKIEYLEDDKNKRTTLKIDKKDKNNVYKNSIDKKYKYLNIFTENNYSDIKYTSNLIKRTVYKSLKITKFNKIKDKNEYKINLTLNDSDVKKIARRVLQKVKLNKRSVNLIKRYTNLSDKDVSKNINKLLENIDSYDYKDLTIDLYYNNKAYKCVINYGNYNIVYNIENNNLIVNKNNVKLLDINIKDDSIISSNGQAKYNFTFEPKDVDDKKAINFIFKESDSLIVTIIYKVNKVSDNEYNCDFLSSINSSFDKIESMGIEANIKLINKK